MCRAGKRWVGIPHGGGGRGGVSGQAAGLWPLCCTHRCVRWLEHQPLLDLSFVFCHLSFVGWFLLAVSATPSWASMKKTKEKSKVKNRDQRQEKGLESGHRDGEEYY